MTRKLTLFLAVISLPVLALAQDALLLSASSATTHQTYRPAGISWNNGTSTAGLNAANGGVTSVNGFTGAVIIETGSLATALANQVLVAKQNGQSFFVSATTSTIASAYSSSATNDTIIVGAGTWPASVVLTPNNAHSFFLEAGAVMTNSGTAATITDAGTNCGVVNIGGFGSFSNSGTSAAVFSISGSGTQLNVACATVAMSRPSATGTVAAISVTVGGYVNLHAASISCSNCSAIYGTGNGSFFVQSDDLIATTGSGVSTVLIGNGTVGTSAQREIPHWITCKRLVSDPNERGFYIPNGVNTQNGVFYINADRISACVEDGINSASSIYLDANLIDPQLNHDGTTGTTSRTVLALNGTTSYYVINIGTEHAVGPTALEIAGGGGVGPLLPGLDVSQIHIHGMYVLGSNPAIVANAGSDFYLTCGIVYNDGNTGLVFNGGQGYFTGTILDSTAVVINATGCVFINSQVQGITVNAGSFNYTNSIFTSGNNSGLGVSVYPGPSSATPAILTTPSALNYPDGIILAEAGILHYPGNGGILAQLGVLNYPGGVAEFTDGTTIFYPGGAALPFVDSTGNLRYNFTISEGSSVQPLLADVSGNLYWASFNQIPLITAAGSMFDFNDALMNDSANQYYVGGVNKVYDDDSIYFNNGNALTNGSYIFSSNGTSVIDNLGNWIGLPLPVVWSNVSGTPTTLAGYGITDAVVKTTGTGSASISANGLLVGQMSETNISTPGTLVGDSPTVIPPVNPPSFISWAAYVKTSGTTTLRLNAIATVTGTAQVWGIKTVR